MIVMNVVNSHVFTYRERGYGIQTYLTRTSYLYFNDSSSFWQSHPTRIERWDKKGTPASFSLRLYIKYTQHVRYDVTSFDKFHNITGHVRYEI